MGNYLAIPHGTNESKESIKRSALSVIRYVEPIDWDGNQVLFALGIAGYQGGHMDILSRSPSSSPTPTRSTSWSPPRSVGPADLRTS